MYFIEQVIHQFQATFASYFEGPGTPGWTPEAATERAKEAEKGKTESSLGQRSAVLDRTLRTTLDSSEKRIGELSYGTSRESGDQINSTSVEYSLGNEVGNTNPPETLRVATQEEIARAFTEIPTGEGEMVISDAIRTDVQRSFEENPLNTEGLTPEEIQTEVERRVVAAKVEEMGTRELTPGSADQAAQTEAEYIASLEAQYALDANALMSLRARNQAGIGGDIDTTGTISDPETYKREMDTLAQNAQKAQEYLAENQALVDAGNTTIMVNAAALLDGRDLATLTSQDTQAYTESVVQDQALGDGFSSLGRLSGQASSGFDSTGSGVGNVNLDPSQLANLPAASVEQSRDLGQLFGSAITKYGSQYGIPQEWANSSALHTVVMKESGGIVGRLNYTFQAVADRMGKSITDPQFITFIHNKLKDGATAGDFGIRSVATGIGQMIKANVLAYYPDQLQGIGEADNEAIGMLRYIKERYGTPENTVAAYGRNHEGY